MDFTKRKKPYKITLNILTNTLDIYKNNFFTIKHGIYNTLTNPRLFISVLHR